MSNFINSFNLLKVGDQSDFGKKYPRLYIILPGSEWRLPLAPIKDSRLLSKFSPDKSRVIKDPEPRYLILLYENTSVIKFYLWRFKILKLSLTYKQYICFRYFYDAILCRRPIALDVFEGFETFDQKALDEKLAILLQWIMKMGSPGTPLKKVDFYSLYTTI